MLQLVLASTEALSDDVSANEKSQQMYDQIMGRLRGRLLAAARNIDTVYGSAERRPRQRARWSR